MWSGVSAILLGNFYEGLGCRETDEVRVEGWILARLLVIAETVS
jgi:hypothetical protein